MEARFEMFTLLIAKASRCIYKIKTEDGDAYMPAVPEFVIDVDLEKGVFVRPIEGMFNEI